MLKRTTALIPFLAAAFLLTGCLDNEEEIVVHPNGAVDVTVTAKSDRADDLTDGYPVPLHGPWKPASETAEAWLELVAPDTGSQAARDGLAALAEGTLPLRDRPLSAHASFESVESWPEWYAPQTEPYRTALLHRTASL